MSRAIDSSSSISARASSSIESLMAAVARSSCSISVVSFARSRPSSCARSGFDQTAGSSSSPTTSSRRSFLLS
jgi:hypothetical protein